MIKTLVAAPWPDDLTLEELVWLTRGLFLVV